MKGVASRSDCEREDRLFIVDIGASLHMIRQCMSTILDVLFVNVNASLSVENLWKFSAFRVA